MIARRGPTLRAQILGKQLHELRVDAGLTLKDVAEYVQRDPATISRLESGLLPARIPDVLAYLDLCGINDPRRREGLKQLSKDIFQKGWWDGYANDVADSLLDRAWLEARAQEIRTFDVIVVPGLLQTRDYAEAVIRAADPDAGAEQIQHWIEVRMNRQQLLIQEKPVRLVSVIDEAVLRRRVGGAAVMHAQLDRLLKSGAEPHIELRVLPAEAGAHASPDGEFEVFEMPEPYLDIAYVATAGGDLYVEAEAVERLASAYDRLRRMALGRKESLAFIADVAKGMT